MIHRFDGEFNVQLECFKIRPNFYISVKHKNFSDVFKIGQMFFWGGFRLMGKYCFIVSCLVLSWHQIFEIAKKKKPKTKY